MALLSRDQILKAEDLKTQNVEVPEWGGTVRVKALTGAERDEFEASMLDSTGKRPKVRTDNFRAKLLVFSVVDDKGVRLFRDEDARELGKKSAAAMQRVVDVAQTLSGITEADVDELVKN